MTVGADRGYNTRNFVHRPGPPEVDRCHARRWFLLGEPQPARRQPIRGSTGSKHGRLRRERPGAQPCQFARRCQPDVRLVRSSCRTWPGSRSSSVAFWPRLPDRTRETCGAKIPLRARPEGVSTMRRCAGTQGHPRWLQQVKNSTTQRERGGVGTTEVLDKRTRIIVMLSLSSVSSCW
jgi:hypothetical protein